MDSDDTATLGAGRTIAGRYRVESVLGQGGMGCVFLARHLSLGSPVAVKVLNPGVARDDEAAERMMREARAVARLRSDHVARVFDVGRLDDGSPFVVMEYLEGRDLAAELAARGPLPPAVAVRYVLEAAAGLAEAHARGIVHRDLKPANLFLADGVGGTRAVKLLDFGIAKIESEGDAALTQTTAVMGSPAYMAPEQLRSSRDVDARADVWAMGAVLYECLTGRRPWTASSISELAMRIATEPPEPLDQQRVSASLAEVVLRCLQKAPDDRPRSMGELARSLEPFADAGAPPLVELIERIGASASARPPEAVPGHPADPPPQSVLSPATEWTTFVGRDEDLAEVHRRLELGGRLLTLQGPAGVGKTRLLRELSRTVDGPFVFVDAGGTASVAELVAEVAAALGVPSTVASDSGVASDRVGRALAARGRFTLFVDGIDAVVAEAGGVLSSWVGGAPAARVVVTSRERLSVRGEAIHELGPIDIDAAVALFLERAAAADPAFERSDDALDDVRALCTRLDGLPLAIELAAARVRVLSPSQIAERVAESLRLLRATTRDAPARHATLTAAIEASFESLAPEERQMLRQLAVFPGSFGVEAAEAVVEVGPEADPLELLKRLRDKSLLAAVRSEDAPGPRFRMYEVIRTHARQKEGPSLDSVLRRHAEHYVRWARELLRGSSLESSRKLDALVVELEHLRAVAERFSDTEPPLAAEAALSLEPALSVRGPVELHRRMLDLAVAGASDPGVRARALEARARLSRRRGDVTSALHDIQAAEEACRLLDDDPTVEGRVRSERGAIERARGDGDRALEALERGLDLARRAGDLAVQAIALDGLAAVHQERSELAEATRRVTDAIDIARRVGDRSQEARMVQNLAAMHHDAGQLATAQREYDEALELAREAGDGRLEGVVLANLGNLACDLGQPDVARARLDAALPHLQRAGDRRLEGNVAMYRGLVELDAGHLMSARGHLETAHELHAPTDPRFAALDHGYLGIVALAEGSPDRAATMFHETGEALGLIGDTHMRAYFGAFEARALVLASLDGADERMVHARRLAGEDAPDWLHFALDCLAPGAGTAPRDRSLHGRLAERWS